MIKTDTFTARTRTCVESMCVPRIEIAEVVRHGGQARDIIPRSDVSKQLHLSEICNSARQLRVQSSLVQWQYMQMLQS